MWISPAKAKMSDQISNYINHAELAISGQGGHPTTLRVARCLYNGFALSRDEVLKWLRVYNERLDEKWTEKELAHKADDAVKGPYDKPRGWMLKSGSQEPPKVTIRPSTFVHRYVLDPKKRAKIKPVKATDATATVESNSSPATDTTDHSGVIVTPNSEDTTETTDISNTTRNAHARAHTRSAEIPQKSVVNAVDLPESESSVVNVVDDPEARRIVAELAKLYRDGAISGPDDPEARFWAKLIHTFGATYTGTIEE
jgi:hypothetical protein